MHRILIACLSPELTARLTDDLEQMFAPLKVTTADTHALAEQHLEYSDFDVALLAPDLRLLQRLRGMSLEVPFLVVTETEQAAPHEFIIQGAQDVLYAAELDGKHLARATQFAIARQDTLNELHGFVQLEREIGRRTDIQPMLEIAIDLIVRRTGARACLVVYIDPYTHVLNTLARLGKPSFIPPPTHADDIDTDPDLSRIFNPRAERVQIDIHNKRILLALETRGHRRGFISLEQPAATMPTPELLRFYKYFSTRIGMAIAKLLTYQLAEYQARQMQRLYEVSMSLMTTMNLDDMLEVAAWGVSNLLEAGAALAATYETQHNTMLVRGLYGAHSLLDHLPTLGTTFHMQHFPHLFATLQQHRSIQRPALDPKHDDDATLLQELETLSPYTSIVMPLPVEDGLLGMIVTFEPEQRYFASNDLALGQSIALQLVNVMQQAALYNEVAELEQLKTEMIQRASHDLKNPIHVMTGYFELLTETLPAERDELQQAAVESINGSLDTMTMLVEDILTLERIENARNIPFNPVDIAALTFEVVGHLQHQASLKQQTLTLELPVQHCVINGDENQMRQVLQNLVNNALKYTPQGGQITVRANTFEGDFYLEVEDNGYGIPKARQEKLFERFYRAQTPGTENIKGSGLGLYLVKQVVERHQGNLWFESSEGDGSTFGLCVPIIAAEGDDAA